MQIDVKTALDRAEEDIGATRRVAIAQLEATSGGYASLVGRHSPSNACQLIFLSTYRNDLVWHKHEDIESNGPTEWPSLLSDDTDEPHARPHHGHLNDLLEILEDTSNRHPQQTVGRASWLQLRTTRRKLFSGESVLRKTILGRDRELQPRSLTSSNCQLACLLYLGIVFIEFAHQPDREALFLTAMEDLIHEEPTRDLSPEHLLVRLLIGFEEDASASSVRNTAVMSLMLEVKKLDPVSCSFLRTRLWSSISLPSEA